MALMGFGDFDDIFGQADRMMNNMMRNMFGSMGDTYSLMDEMMMMMPRTPFPRFPPVPLHPQLSLSTMPYMISNSSVNNSYSYSSVMTMSSGYGGQPTQVYEETHSTRFGSDGVKETRSSVRDSASGYQKMSIGHHIQDRAHITSRSRNCYTGEEERNDEYINLDEDEADTFNSEWKEKTRNGFNGNRYHRSHRQLPQVPNTDNDSDVEVLALPAPPTPQEQLQQSQPKQSRNDSRPTASTSTHHRESRLSPIQNKHKLESVKQRTKRNKKPYKK